MRTLGLPGMTGALGVCFGRVITMDSPKARPPGEFQWEATLWHEMAHVVTLQMSNQRVPRWLTEGISVYEETLARPEWGRAMDVEFAQILNRGEELSLEKLNEAFTDPRTISLAYYQASLLVEHLVAIYGDAGIHKLLRAYGEGLDTDAALKTALDTSLDALQSGFDKRIAERFATLRAAMKAPDAEKIAALPLPALREMAKENPGSFPVQMLLARALRKEAAAGVEGALDEAVRALEAAAALVPIARGPEAPQLQLAEIARERKDAARETAALQAVVAADFDNVEAARRLATLLREAKVTDPARLRPVYERIAAIDPFDAQAHEALGRMALDARRCRHRDPRVPRGRGARSGRRRRGAHRSRRELPEGRPPRRGPQADARRARDRPELRARAESAAVAVGEPVMRASAGRALAAARARRRRRLPACCCPPCPPPVAAQLPIVGGRPLRRTRVAVRPHQVSLHHRGHVDRAGLLRRAVVHRRARPPSRTCRAVSRRRPRFRSRIRSS